MTEQFLEPFEAFYLKDSGLAVPYYRRQPDSSHQTLGQTDALRVGEWVSDRDVEEKLIEVARNRQVIEHGGDTFDVSFVTDNDRGKPFMIHMSTYGSSLDNAGNAWEFGVQCLLYPEYNHVYVASFANGASSPIPERDGQRDWVVQTGRLTKMNAAGEVEPIDIMRNLYQGLERHNINMIRVMGADSAGVSSSRAISLAIPPGQLESAVFSGATGLRHLSTPGIAGAMGVEMVVNDRRNKRLGLRYDAARMTTEKADKARKIMQEYANPELLAKIDANRVRRSAVLSSRLVTGRSLRHGPTSRANPIVEETDAMNERHAQAVIWYIMGELDPLYGGKKIAHALASAFVSRVAVSSADLGVAVVPSYSHATHTYLPQLREGVSRGLLAVSNRPLR